MKLTLRFISFVLLLFLLNPLKAETDSLKITLFDSLDIGNEKYLFSSISSVCEDSNENFYVVDRLERKVLKFNSEGNLVLSFGQKGQGPGDFQSPGRIILNEQDLLAVSEEINDISFHKLNGEFIHRIHLSGRLSTGYVGENLYYAWTWKPEVQQQVLVDEKNKVIKTFYSVPKNSFSVSAPDETGRMVMFNYSSDVFAPSLLFAHHSSLSAVAKSTLYEIILLDSKGNEINRLKRDIQPLKISKNEKNYFKDEIKDRSYRLGWPPKVTKDLIDLIPRHKAFFNHICLSDQHLFVFRIPEDITKENVSLPVDVFSLKGSFLGTTELPFKAVYISKEYMYFVKTDSQGNVSLTRKSYKIKVNSPE
jgi:hypothetical protein